MRYDSRLRGLCVLLRFPGGGQVGAGGGGGFYIIEPLMNGRSSRSTSREAPWILTMVGCAHWQWVWARLS